MAIEMRFNRFKDAPWYKAGSNTEVIVGGAGGVGSWLAVLLTRAGFMPHIYDFDSVEVHNLGGQLFPASGVGQAKVDVLAKVIQDFTGETVTTYNEKVTSDTMVAPIIFVAFDNIKARKEMFLNWKENYKGDPGAIFMDARLLAEQFTIISIKGDGLEDIDYYLNYMLPDDKTIPDAPCNMKQTSHVAAMIAGTIVSLFTNWYSKIIQGYDTRYTSFFWEMFTPLMKIEEYATSSDYHIARYLSEDKLSELNKEEEAIIDLPF